MAGYTLTVDVPPDLYNQLQQRAAASARRVEDEVILTLAAALPNNNLPDDLAELLASFSALDDATLWRLARSRVADADQARLADLADQRQRDGLSVDELREAEELAERHDRVIAVRAKAAALLKARGHDIRPLLSGA